MISWSGNSPLSAGPGRLLPCSKEPDLEPENCAEGRNSRPRGLSDPNGFKRIKCSPIIPRTLVVQFSCFGKIVGLNPRVSVWRFLQSLMGNFGFAVSHEIWGL
jgi:hypothetical protein